MHEKQQLNYISMLLSDKFVIPDSHFRTYFGKLDHSHEEMGKMTSISQRDGPEFIPSGTNVSFRVTKFGAKLSWCLIVQKYISLFDNISIHSLYNLKCKGRLPPPQNTIFWPLHRRRHMVGNIISSTFVSFKLNSNWMQSIKHNFISDM